MSGPDLPQDAVPPDAARAATDLILDFDGRNPKHLRWAATQHDRLAAELRASGDLAGAVAAQIQAERYRMNASTLAHPHGAPSYALAASTVESEAAYQNDAFAHGPVYDVEDVGLSDD